MIQSLLAAREISALILKSVLHPPAEAHSRPSHASQTELFARIVNLIKLMLLVFSKNSVVDICRAC